MVRRIWPIILLFLIEIVLVAANYTPGTWLMGWDNVMPEFNFQQAFVTNIFGVWQEHRGLGLYDGMGHAANLLHTLFLWLLSFALPTSLLRYSFHFLMHLLGGIGAYILIKKLIDNHNAAALRLSITRWIALAGGLFYQYNLATIQMFYTPLEAFSVHFAALPWLAWSLITYLQEGSRKRFLLFLLISLLSTPQFFIPTLLLPLAILLFSLSISSIIWKEAWSPLRHIPSGTWLHSVLSPWGWKIATIKRTATAGVGFLLVNAFWLLPYVYGLPRNAPVIQEAKINQMSSSDVFARNQAFGGLSDVLRLRGFPLDFEDTAASGATTYLMAPWREFISHPLVQAFSWLSVALTLLGLISVGTILIAAARKITPIERRTVLPFAMPFALPFAMPFALPFAMPFAVALVFLANDTPIVKDLTQLVREAIPLFAEGYRFPFTKFSLLFALSSAVLFAVGISWIAEKIARVHKKIAVAAPLVGTILVISLALSAVRGNFLSDRLRVTLPDDYLRIFALMRDKPLGRVAYLPQHQYWSWKYYQWEYRGSGFAWYGLPQPLLDRAFDPWSGYNENYYWEISRSIYSKDARGLAAVMDKYDVRYIVLDENLISPSHNRALYTDEIKAMLASLPEVKENARFGNITVYERVGDDTQPFISLKTNLPKVSPAYRWTDNDVAFGDVGDYIAISDKREVISKNSYIYPFRSLFTKRSVDEREVTIEEREENLILRSRALPGFPVFFEKGYVEEQKNNEKQRVGNTDFNINIHPIDHTNRLSSDTATINDTIPANRLIVNGNTFRDTSEKKIFGNRSTDPSQAADKLVNNPDSTRNQDFLRRLDISTSVTKEGTVVNVTTPKADALVYDSSKGTDLAPENVKPCGVLREGTARARNLDQFLQFTSRNQRGCLSFGVGNLPHRDGYLVAVESRHISGRPMLFSLINDTAKHVEVETYLQPQRVRPFEATDYFILPPLAPDGLGYTVYLSNDAIGPASAKATAGEGQETVNDIKSIKFYRIPYQELVTMRLPSLERLDSRLRGNDIVNVEHPNPAYYKIEISDKRKVISDNKTLVLNQSFDPGWKAYEISEKCKAKSVKCKITEALPFLFGTEIKDHVLVNNWENGWGLAERGINTNNPIIQFSNYPTQEGKLPSDQVTNNELTIVIFFLPQLLQWLGFALLPVPFLWLWYSGKRT